MCKTHFNISSTLDLSIISSEKQQESSRAYFQGKERTSCRLRPSVCAFVFHHPEVPAGAASDWEPWRLAGLRCLQEVEVQCKISQRKRLVLWPKTQRWKIMEYNRVEATSPVFLRSLTLLAMSRVFSIRSLILWRLLEMLAGTDTCSLWFSTSWSLSMSEGKDWSSSVTETKYINKSDGF